MQTQNAKCNIGILDMHLSQLIFRKVQKIVTTYKYSFVWKHNFFFVKLKSMHMPEILFET